MSTRIIIEKDGERYAPVDLFDHWFADDMSSMGMSNDDGEIEFAIKPLPPVIRTDNSEVIAKLEDENAKLRDEIIKVIAARNELLDLNRDCCDENDKLREALKDVLIVAKNRIPTIPTVFECEAIGKAQDVINGISRKDEDISRKGGAE